MSRRNERQRRPALEPMEGRLAPSAIMPGGGPGVTPSGGLRPSPSLQADGSARANLRGIAFPAIVSSGMNDDPHGA
jgi:hypothetical protein